ncbi:unnamed protein product [Timema podura]|uniref:Uncharacterized protein n=1 Tax=Timema podura TaxID=61482 RepID=A0ABN7PF05_TIMPD|nr:unnamed protein product [Timema podura]
MLPKDLMTG